MTSSLLYLVRHCSATGQEPSAGLTVAGQAQSAALAQFFSSMKIERIVSSPYRRALETAAAIAAGKDLTVTTDERLIERVLSPGPLPDWEPHLRASFQDLDLVLPGGESGRTAMARGKAVADDLRHRASGNTAIVTHGNLMALILRSFDGNFGFDDWRTLTNPDVYRVDSPGFTSRIWNHGSGLKSVH